MTKEILQFDPDKFVLTKKDFLQILDNIGDRWSKNKKDNWKLMLELEGAKLYFHLKSDNSIQMLWTEIIKEINEILIQNTIEYGKINDDSNLKIFEQIKKGKLLDKQK